MSQHFYDGQIRRYITQIIRLMSNFSWKDGSGNLKQVPVMYGDITRQVASIISENSENKIPSVPRMSVYVTGLEMDRNRTSDSSYINKVNIRERAFDANGNEYLNTQGKNYTVERLMPSPYTLRVNVDIWSSNTEQKLQIMEQILMLFNPSLEIQTTDNYVDWTSLSVVNLEQIQFSNRTIPVGVETEIDVGTLGFSTPIYISPPAKVKRLGVITNIITSIFNEANGDIDLGNAIPIVSAYSDTPFPTEQVTTTTETNGEVTIETERRIDATQGNRVTMSTTYKDFGLYVEGTVGKLIDGRTVGGTNWRTILESYPGEYKAGVSQIRLKQESNNYIIGTFTLNPLDETQITVSWDLDTLPSDDIIEGPARNTNSWTSIDYIIDPERWNPQSQLTEGLRLLLLGNVGSVDNTDGADAWKSENSPFEDLVANEGDIIEWDGTHWHIVFDASTVTDITYVSNLNTGIQYKWTGEFWIKSYEGEYSGGNWMVYLDG